jgi:hypothetical protein
MRFQRVVGLASAMLSLAACKSEEEEELEKVCARICQGIETCELLPSSLGYLLGAEANHCEALCLSSEDSWAEYCGQLHFTPVPDSNRLCTNQPCGQFLECLETFSGSHGITGIVEVLVETGESLPPIDLPEEWCGDDSLWTGGDAGSFDPYAACEALGANYARVAVVNEWDEELLIDEVNCTSILWQFFLYTEVPVGAYQGIITFHSIQNGCVGKAYGTSESVHVSEFALDSSVSYVPLDSAGLYGCERDPATCGNFEDDDGDGYVDCLDPECVQHCASSMDP